MDIKTAEIILKYCKHFNKEYLITDADHDQVILPFTEEEWITVVNGISIVQELSDSSAYWSEEYDCAVLFV